MVRRTQPALVELKSLAHRLPYPAFGAAVCSASISSAGFSSGILFCNFLVLVTEEVPLGFQIWHALSRCRSTAEASDPTDATLPLPLGLCSGGAV